jgi:cell division protein FtsL
VIKILDLSHLVSCFLFCDLQLVGVEVICLQSLDLVLLIVTSNGFILLALSTVTLVFHTRALHQEHAAILADKAKYDQAWADIMANNTQRDQVELLANQVKLIQNLSPHLIILSWHGAPV